MKRNLLDFDAAGLAAFFEELGEKPFRARQVLKWIHQSGEGDFAAMSDLAKSLREKLAAVARVHAPTIVGDTLASDGTRKWLLKVDTANSVEAVFIPETNRGTLCLSSQAGCVLDCAFCSTGKQGFNRNLSTGEIIGQLWLAEKILSEKQKSERNISNVVMMGMGEPMLNLDNVIPALKLMLDDNAYGLSRRRVTVSTAGVIPGMDRLRDECPVALAISLHAPNDTLRGELVPLNKKYGVAEIIAACKRFPLTKRSRITFEYVLLAGVNDSPDDARQLAKLLAGVKSKVNLIPLNAAPGIPFERPSDRAIDQFAQILADRGLLVSVRKSRGRDIRAACGQLIVEGQRPTPAQRLALALR